MNPAFADAAPAPRSLAQQLIGLAVAVAFSFGVAAVGSIASTQAGSFYTELQRPAWAPPAWLFGPVWSALYLAMAVAAWLVWRSARPWQAATGALVLYVVQLAANALWTWLFFGWQLGAWAMADVVLLALLIVATMTAFRRHSLPAALLLVPYLAWVLFAAALTWSIWRMNPLLLGSGAS